MTKKFCDKCGVEIYPIYNWKEVKIEQSKDKFIVFDVCESCCKEIIGLFNQDKL